MSESSPPSRGGEAAARIAESVRFQIGERLPAVPAIYFNGFNVSLSSADVNSLLLLDGRPVARLNMSFTTAKTVVALLGQLVDRLEEITGREIMTSDVVHEGLQKHNVQTDSRIASPGTPDQKG